MACVYILESERNGRFYIGSTSDIKRRLQQHNEMVHPFSKRNAPFKLVFKQDYKELKTARKIECRLKKFKRKDFLEKIVRDGEIRARSSVGQSS